MECVRLVSGNLGGKAFIDSKGRTLFDISNAAHFAGESVFTDGRYIYGWQKKDNTPMRLWQPIDGGYVYELADGKIYYFGKDLAPKYLCSAPKGSYLILGTNNAGTASYAYLCTVSKTDEDSLHYDVYNLIKTDKDGMPVLDGSFDIPGLMAMEIAIYVGGQSLFDDISFDASVTEDGKFQAVYFRHGGKLYEWSGMFTWKASQYTLYPSGDMWKIRLYDDDGGELDMAAPSYVHITRDGKVHSIVTMGYIDKDWLKHNFLAVYPLAKYGTGTFPADSVFGFFDNDTKGELMGKGREMWTMVGWKPTNIAISSSIGTESYDVSFDSEDWHISASNAHHSRLGHDVSSWTWNADCIPIIDWKKQQEQEQENATASDDSENRISISMPREAPLNVARKPMSSGKRVCLTTKGIYVGGEKVVENERMHSKRIEWMSQNAIAKIKAGIMAINAKLGNGKQEEGETDNG